MNKIKKSKGFLEFEWKKFILPIFLILFFSYHIYFFYSISNQIDNYYCISAPYIKDLVLYRQQNNSDMLYKTSNELKPMSDKMSAEIIKLSKYMAFEKIIFILDPFFPSPCEFSNEESCRYYGDRKSLECIGDVRDQLPTPTMPLFATPEFKHVSIWILTIHFILLFTIGYLISAVILWIFRNIKIKK